MSFGIGEVFTTSFQVIQQAFGMLFFRPFTFTDKKALLVYGFCHKIKFYLLVFSYSTPPSRSNVPCNAEYCVSTHSMSAKAFPLFTCEIGIIRSNIISYDRQGVPVAIDISGKEGINKLTDNSNFFCLGPSGSGKSFHMYSTSTINGLKRPIQNI